MNIKIEAVSETVWRDNLNCIASDETRQGILFGIIQDMDINSLIAYDKEIKVDCKKSLNALNKQHFKWPRIDGEYIFRIIDYMKRVHFISKMQENSESYNC
jgi:hypothetical protein